MYRTTSARARGGVAYLLCCWTTTVGLCKIRGVNPRPISAGSVASWGSVYLLFCSCGASFALLKKGSAASYNESRRCCAFPAAWHGVSYLAGLLAGRQHILLPPRGRGSAHSPGVWQAKRGVWYTAVVPMIKQYGCFDAGRCLFFREFRLRSFSLSVSVPTFLTNTSPRSCHNYCRYYRKMTDAMLFTLRGVV